MLKENTKCGHFLTSSNLNRAYDVDLGFNLWLNVTLKTEGESGLCQLSIHLFEVKAKGQYWPLTCNTYPYTMFDIQAVNI